MLFNVQDCFFRYQNLKTEIIRNVNDWLTILSKIEERIQYGVIWNADWRQTMKHWNLPIRWNQRQTEFVIACDVVKKTCFAPVVVRSGYLMVSYGNIVDVCPIPGDTERIGTVTSIKLIVIYTITSLLLKHCHSVV